MEKIYTAKEIAEILGLHISTVWRFLGEGLIKGFKIGGNGKSNRRWRVWQSDLDAFTKRGDHDV